MKHRKKLIATVIIGIALLIWNRPDTRTWSEDTQLSDGRVITIVQKRSMESVYTGHDVGSMARDAWISFSLPEFSAREIEWHVNLTPIILNISNGKLYIVAYPFTIREAIQFGNPQPPYVGFRFENEKWVQIPFSEIPVAIYEVNLLIDSPPEKIRHRVTLNDKRRDRENIEFPQRLKRIDPTNKNN